MTARDLERVLAGLSGLHVAAVACLVAVLLNGSGWRTVLAFVALVAASVVWIAAVRAHCVEVAAAERAKPPDRAPAPVPERGPKAA